MLVSPSSQEQTGMLFAIRLVNAPLTWNNFLSRAADFNHPSCNLHVKQLFSSRWMNIYMREGIGAEVSAPPAFGTSVSLHKSHYSRPFISHVPFIAVPPQPSIRRSLWTVVHWLFWVSLLYVVYEYLHLSILWYIHGRLRGNGWCGLIRWIQIRLLYVPVK